MSLEKQISARSAVEVRFTALLTRKNGVICAIAAIIAGAVAYIPLAYYLGEKRGDSLAILNHFVAPILIYLVANSAAFFSFLALLYIKQMVEARNAIIGGLLWLPSALCALIVGVGRTSEDYPDTSPFPEEFFSALALEVPSALVLSLSLTVLAYSALRRRRCSRPVSVVTGVFLAGNIGWVYLHVVNPWVLTVFYTVMLAVLLLFAHTPKTYEGKECVRPEISKKATWAVSFLSVLALVHALLYGLWGVYSHLFANGIGLAFSFGQLTDFLHPVPSQIITLLIAWGIFETSRNRWQVRQIWFPILCFSSTLIAMWIMGRLSYPFAGSLISPLILFLITLAGILYYVDIRVRIGLALKWLLGIVIAFAWLMSIWGSILYAPLIDPYPAIISIFSVVLLVRTHSYTPEEYLQPASS